MKTVTNKTHAPIRVPLRRGKSLHLGPKKTGRIRDEDATHERVVALVDAGKIEIFDAAHEETSATSGPAPHEATHGLGKAAFSVRKIGSS